MKIVKPNVVVFEPVCSSGVLQMLELAGRTCYKSHDRITENSAEKFVQSVINNGHEAMLEHVSISAVFITDRGISHEIVRHRLASYAQESTRYCNYGNEKFGREISVVCPSEILNKGTESLEYTYWESACKNAENSYFNLLDNGCSPQIARSVLPTCLKTEIFVTMNIREWRHFFKMRCSKRAHPDIQLLANEAREKMRAFVPVVFDNIQTQET